MGRKAGANQEIIAFVGRPSISHSYDLDRAQSAAARRRQRRVNKQAERKGQYQSPLNQLQLNKRTSGFVKASGGLFVPKSGTENSAVILSPEAKLVREKHMLVDAVMNKYQDDERISPDKARRLGRFAAREHEVRFHSRNYNYIINAKQDFWALCQALEPGSLEFDAEAIRESELATRGIVRYLVSLKSFVGLGRPDGKKRQWLQTRWTHKVMEAKHWAEGVIDALPAHELEDVYDEAVYSSWSRELYWQGAEKRRVEKKRELANREPDYIEVPISVYENTPDAFSQR